MLTQNEVDNWKIEVDKVIKERKLKFIQLEATRSCNLKCVHCGSPSEGTNSNELLTRNEIRQTLEEIATNIIDTSFFNHLMFVGGEPFSRKDLLEIIEDAYTIKVGGVRIYTNNQIQTNGIYIGKNPEILNQLKKVGVTGFGISLDGLENTHNSFRGMQNAFSITYNAIKESIKKGFSVSISTVVNQSNISEVPQLSKLIRTDLKPNYWRIMLLDPIGRARLDKKYLLSPENVKETIKFVYKEHVEHIEDAYVNGQDTKIELGCGGWCGRELEGMVRPYLWHCIAGVSMLGIMYDGGIGGCTNISRDFLEGNIRVDSITNVWKDRFQKFREFEWKKTGECKDCGEWIPCDGGPMHYRLNDGSMIFCLYQTLHNNRDYRSNVTDNILQTKAGN